MAYLSETLTSLMPISMANVLVTVEENFSEVGTDEVVTIFTVCSNLKFSNGAGS